MENIENYLEKIQIDICDEVSSGKSYFFMTSAGGMMGDWLSPILMHNNEIMIRIVDGSWQVLNLILRHRKFTATHPDVTPTQLRCCYFDETEEALVRASTYRKMVDIYRENIGNYSAFGFRESSNNGFMNFQELRKSFPDCGLYFYSFDPLLRMAAFFDYLEFVNMLPEPENFLSYCIESPYGLYGLYDAWKGAREAGASEIRVDYILKSRDNTMAQLPDLMFKLGANLEKEIEWDKVEHWRLSAEETMKKWWQAPIVSLLREKLPILDPHLWEIMNSEDQTNKSNIEIPRINLNDYT